MSLKDQSTGSQQHTNPIKNQMFRPSQRFQNPTTRARHKIGVVENDDDIGRKSCHQTQATQQTGFTGFWKHQESA